MSQTRPVVALTAAFVGVALAGCSAGGPSASAGPSTAPASVTAGAPSAEKTMPVAAARTGSSVTGTPVSRVAATDTATPRPTAARSTTARRVRSPRPSRRAPGTSPAATGGVPTEVAAAVRRLRPVRPQGADMTLPWEVDDLSGYDPSASISAVVVRAANTGSAWVQVLLFHDGRYLGRATSRPVESAELFDDDAPPDTVGVHYQWGPAAGASNGDPQYQHEAVVGFRWNGRRVVMQGTLPDAAFL